MKRQKGYTLIELLVVIAIIAILSMIAMVSFSTANVKTRNSRRAADIMQIRSALEVYRTTNGYYPTTAQSYDVASFSGPVPKDPKTNINYSYTATPNGCTGSTCTGYTLVQPVEGGEDGDITYTNP